MKHSPASEPAQGPWRVTFDTNPDTCNLHCIMCEEHSPYSARQMQRATEGKPPRIMPFEIIEHVIAELAGHGLREVIPSTMGEPLLYGEFGGIIELCKTYGLAMNLTTNGTFPRLGASEWARLITPIASDVKVSLNGASKDVQESIMHGSRFDHTVRGLKEFIAVRDETQRIKGHYCGITLQMTFLESNRAEIPEIVRLGGSLGVDRIKGHHLWDHFEEIKPLSLRRNSEATARWNATVAMAEKAARDVLASRGRQIALENILPLDAARQGRVVGTGECPFIGKEAWVNHDGRFDPCCAPDALRQSLGSFGNVREGAFMDLWEAKGYVNLAQQYRTIELCMGCTMRKTQEATA